MVENDQTLPPTTAAADQGGNLHGDPGPVTGAAPVGFASNEASTVVDIGRPSDECGELDRAAFQTSVGDEIISGSAQAPAVDEAELQIEAPPRSEAPHEHVSRAVPVDRDTAQREIARLAKLDRLDYERERKSTADRLAVRASAIDELVEQARGRGDASAPGGTVLFEEVAPASSPMPLGDLLDELTSLYSRHVVLPSHAADAAALWTVTTWAAECTDHAAILLLRSPEPRCGKTTLMSLLDGTAYRPLSTANITPAAMFRIIEQESPTLLIDEGDAFLAGNNELRGVINAGHTRATAYVIRTVGEQHEPRRFGVYGFKALALIGNAPHTIADRSIVINLRRKLPSERVAKLRDVPKSRFDRLKRALARWSLDHAAEVRRARPPVPEALNDRAADSWQPLLAVAEIAGGQWPHRARVAAVSLSGHLEQRSLGVELLADVQRVFQRKQQERLASADLVADLVADAERPWASFNRGQPMTQAQLANRLGAFGIISQSVRLSDGRNLKGYKIEQFSDAFSRYLPSDRAGVGTVSPANVDAGCDASPEVKSSSLVTGAGASRSSINGTRDSVTLQGAQTTLVAAGFVAANDAESEGGFDGR